METHEPWLSGWLHATVTEDMVFVDVGAAQGYFTLLAARAKAIIAIEPDPGQLETFRNQREGLRENIRRAGLTNVTIVAKPLWSKVVRGAILVPGRKFVVAPDGPMETTTLDILGLAPDIIKIDAEGAEYDILVGGMETLRQYTPALLVEVHPKQLPRYGHRTEHVYHLLRAMGYEITELEKYGERQWIRAEI